MQEEQEDISNTQPSVGLDNHKEQEEEGFDKGFFEKLFD